MKYSVLLFFVFLVFITGCEVVAQEKAMDSGAGLDIQKVVVDEKDKAQGYYLMVQPESKKIDGVLVLFPGFGQSPEDIFLDTQLPEYAAKNHLLTIGWAGRTRLTADRVIQEKLTAVLQDVLQKNKISGDNFFLGGFSAGGNIALRYAELCKEFPDRFPINPRGVFMADAPVDLFHSWALQEENLKNNFSEISVAEANQVAKFYRVFYGATPAENQDTFRVLSPFSINKSLGDNEKFLKNIAVRAYHDIDVSWRLVNRNQTAKFDNYIATSELINRLMLMGNKEAEFIQTFQTGYRRNGDRHPHSWSIIDAEECVNWLKNLINKE